MKKLIIILIIFFTQQLPNGRLGAFYSIPGVIGIAYDRVDCYVFEGASRNLHR
jgi:hypothetical protein